MDVVSRWEDTLDTLASDPMQVDRELDWVYLKLNDPEREPLLWKDPFQFHDERVEHMIRSF